MAYFSRNCYFFVEYNIEVCFFSIIYKNIINNNNNSHSCSAVYDGTSATYFFSVIYFDFLGDVNILGF